MESQEAVGQRIAQAREFLGLTQAVVAEKLGLARTTQVAIEQGKRPVSVAELYRYAEVLSRPVDYFLGLGAWGKVDFQPQFRRIADKLDVLSRAAPRSPGRPRGEAEPSGEKLALATFEQICRHYLELEEQNGLPRTAMPELPAPRNLSVPEAEQLAATVRAHLDLGPDSPIRDLRVRLEDAFGLRVYVLPQRSRLACAAFQHPAIGGSVLLVERTVSRMRLALAVALGHLVAERSEVMVEIHGGSSRRRDAVETFAHAFASALLLPARGLRERFASLHAETGDASDLAVLFLARAYGVPLRTLRQRIETLRLAGGAALRRLDAALAGATSDTGETLDPGPGIPDQARWEMLPERYVFLAMRAFRKGLIDRARLAECLYASENETALRLIRWVGSASEPPRGPAHH